MTEFAAEMLLHKLRAALAADMEAVQKMALRLIGSDFFSFFFFLRRLQEVPTSSITDFKSFDSRIEVTSNVLKF